MNARDRFERHLEDLLADLAGQAMPAYIDEALATATARPQRQPSIVSRLGWGRNGSMNASRYAAVGLSVSLVLAIGVVGLLMIGTPDPSPSPSPVPTLAGTNAPTSVPVTPAPATSTPTGAAVGPCPGYVESTDARTLGESGGVAWQAETGPQPPIGSMRDGLIAAEARQLPGGRPAVVLIDPTTGDACRLIDLGADEEVHQLQWTSRGDALAVSTVSRAFVWSSAGITELYRIPSDRTSGFTVAWSPTGEAIAVGSGADDNLRIVEGDASVTELPVAVVLELAWSPNGRRLHVGQGVHVGGTILHALVTDREMIDRIDIGSTVDNGERVAGWLDDDTLIVGSSGVPGYDAYDTASGNRLPWASTQPFDSAIDIGYAPGLTALALFAGIDTKNPVDLVVRDLPSGVDHVLEERIRAGNQVIGTGTWSPNGSRLAVSIQPGPGARMTGVWLYGRDGSEPIQVSTLDVSLTNGAWQPLP